MLRPSIALLLALGLVAGAERAAAQASPQPQEPSAFDGSAAPSGASAPDGPELIGLELQTALRSFGPPQHVYPIRGDQPWQDDVVFFYSTHLYLYWYDDRVWQVRFDRNFEGSVLGLSMGASREDAQKSLGKPIASREDWEIFQLPDRGFPVRARLFFTSDRLSDIYIYRSDF